MTEKPSCTCDYEWAAMREDRDMFQAQVESIRKEIRERLEAVMCDRKLCGHFLPSEILACCDKVWPPR